MVLDVLIHILSNISATKAECSFMTLALGGF